MIKSCRSVIPEKMDTLKKKVLDDLGNGGMG